MAACPLGLPRVLSPPTHPPGETRDRLNLLALLAAIATVLGPQPNHLAGVESMLDQMVAATDALCS